MFAEVSDIRNTEIAKETKHFDSAIANVPDRSRVAFKDSDVKETQTKGYQ